MRRSEERIAVVLRSPLPTPSSNGSALGKNRSTLEAAFGLAKHKKVHITAIGVFAGAQDDEICQQALDLGCDASLAIDVPVPFDFFGEALLLRAVISSSRASLILCPDFDESYEGSLLGAALAFMLNVPCITGVSDCKFKGDDYLVSRRSEHGTEQFRCPRPALLALVDGIPGAAANNPNLSAARAVQRKAASEVLDDLSVLYSRSSLATHAAPRPTPVATELLSDPHSLLSQLKAAKLWNAG
jgi:electron transfer flavoprotein alpha/beta subunit